MKPGHDNSNFSNAVNSEKFSTREKIGPKYSRKRSGNKILIHYQVQRLRKIYLILILTGRPTIQKVSLALMLPQSESILKMFCYIILNNSFFKT